MGSQIPATALGVRTALWILTALIAASGLTFLLTPMRHLRDLPRRPAEDSVPARAGLIKRLKHRAIESEMSLSALVTEALRDYLRDPVPLE